MTARTMKGKVWSLSGNRREEAALNTFNMQ